MRICQGYNGIKCIYYHNGKGSAICLDCPAVKIVLNLRPERWKLLEEDEPIDNFSERDNVLKDISVNGSIHKNQEDMVYSIMELLKDLDIKTQHMFMERFIHRESLRKIAKRHGVSHMTVKTHTNRALEYVKEQLKRKILFDGGK